MNPRTLLRIDQVSERTGIPERTLRWYRQQGTGPKSFRLGGRVVWDADDVDRWVDDQAAAGARRRGAGLESA